jgi:kynurenine formamidase
MADEDTAAYAAGWDAASVAELEALVAPLSNWGRWGADDERGTTNLLTPGRAAAAAAEVRAGETYALGRGLSTADAPDNHRPLQHHMLSLGAPPTAAGGSHASDWLGLAFHGFAVTHLDAPAHQRWAGGTYNGRGAASVGATGAAAGSVEPFADGLVGRGVLLDLARARGERWLEPGTTLGPGDLDAAAAAQGVEVGAGDLLLLRTGRDARAAELGVVDPVSAGSPGLGAECLPWLRAHDVAVLGSETATDVMAPGGRPHPMPVHVGALVFLGLPLLDNLALDALAAACARDGRWTFLLAVGPLRLPRATGSPVNPLALR